MKKWIGETTHKEVTGSKRPRQTDMNFWTISHPHPCSSSLSFSTPPWLFFTSDIFTTPLFSYKNVESLAVTLSIFLLLETPRLRFRPCWGIHWKNRSIIAVTRLEADYEDMTSLRFSPKMVCVYLWRPEKVTSREVLQSEIRMQIFEKLGLRTHESSDGPANRRVVLQTETWSFCSIGLLIMALAAGGVWSFDRSVWQPSLVWDQLFGVVSCSVVVEDFRTSLFSDCSLMKTVTSTKKSWCAALPTRKRKIKSIASTSSNWIDRRRSTAAPGSKSHPCMPLTKVQTSINWTSPKSKSRWKKMLANPVEWKEPTEPPFWTSWTTGFTSRKSDLETKNLFAKKAVHTNFRVDIREYAPFFSHLVPGPLRKLQFSFCKTSLLLNMHSCTDQKKVFVYSQLPL